MISLRATAVIILLPLTPIYCFAITATEDTMYHTIRIRDLAPQSLEPDPNQKGSRKTYECSDIDANYWAKSIDRSSDYDKEYYFNAGGYRQTYFEANGPHTHIVNSGHALLEAYLAAYNAHEDLVLSPDDIWLMITIYYSRYVVDHAEQLRPLFVEHEGKKGLSVETMSIEPNWPEFLIEMQRKVGKNVKHNVVDLLKANFSTTSSIESLLSSACIMHTFKKYFDYEHISLGCGIRNVHFMGTIDDWKLLRKKTEDLKVFTGSAPSSYASSGGFSPYLDGVLPILDQFIRTYEGDVDNDFWDTIFDYTKIRVFGSSGISYTVDGVRGWFLRLCYGFHHSNSEGGSLRDIGLGAISVPVKLIDLAAGGKESSCYVVGGFHGIHSSKDGKHRPVMSLAVYEEESYDTHDTSAM